MGKCYFKANYTNKISLCDIAQSLNSNPEWF
jgi:hypothetical protein